ncbi:response regulator [Singulisphaera rosea]
MLILIVEDDRITRHALRSLLIQAGHEVVETSTCVDALAALDSAPDWLILDLMLPDGDGEAVLRKIREERMATSVAVITSTADRKRVETVLDLRPDLLMTKPINFLRFLSILKEGGPRE